MRYTVRSMHPSYDSPRQLFRTYADAAEYAHDYMHAADFIIEAWTLIDVLLGTCGNKVRDRYDNAQTARAERASSADNRNA